MNDVGPRRRTKRLPPLNLLRTFEAAARNLSFTLAAEELLITQSAVSQQIRQLEEFMDVRLFRRLPRRLELTREAIDFAGAIHEAIELMGQACARIRDPDGPTILCVNATPDFASRWLTPRLKNFMTAFPNIKVTLISSGDRVDFRRQDVDVAIRWGSGEWADMHATQLGNYPLIPVCSPGILRGTGAVTLDTLPNFVLLQVINQAHWAQWISERGLQRSHHMQTLYFSDPGLMLEAAIEGQGICLASSLIAQKEIESGRLVVPFLEPLSTPDCYFLLSDSSMVEKPKISAFREWMISELSGEAPFPVS